MYTKNFSFKDFKKKRRNKVLQKYLKQLVSSNNEIIKSFTGDYKYSYTRHVLSKLKKYKYIRIFGMGGSSLGANAIYDFLKFKIKRDFYFLSNLKNIKFTSKKSFLNLIISKSGNTTETVVNSNIHISNKDKNVIITENKINTLRKISYKLKAEVIDHNNFIGGRYSVLSEVGMLPAELMGLKESKFKQLNNLVKNKYFYGSIISNVLNTLDLIRRKKSNSVLLNYDDTLNNFLSWYQQLLAESTGKKGKGIFPIISTMPKDNHSLMQLYLDGQKNNFYTFFFSNDTFSPKINSKMIDNTQKYLKNKSLNDILFSQIFATKKVFKKKNIPFRSFFLKTRREETLGELFVFFLIETILLGKVLNVNPYDQPSVELIKKETKKILVKS